MVSTPTARINSKLTLVWGSVFFFFVSPVFVLLLHLFFQDINFSMAQFDLAEFLWALKNSFWLGGVSSLLSLILGFLLSFGLGFSEQKLPRLSGYLRQALLFPIYLPPFFVILIFFYWFDFAPLGLASSALAQTLTYAGMVAVLLSRIFSEALSDLSEVAQVQGLSRGKFFWMSRALVSKPILAVVLFVFAVSFSSFSIPLVLSGGKGTTLEILIYEKVKISQDFGSALSFSLFQSLLLGLFFWLISSQFSVSSFRTRSSRMFSSRVGFLFLLLWLLVQIFPWIGQSREGWDQAWRQLTEAPNFWDELLQACANSLGLAISAMTLVCGLSLGLIYLMIFSKLPQAIRSYFPLSVSLLGLSGLLLMDILGVEGAYLYSLVLMILPALLRLNIESKMQTLEPQIQVAQIMGANKFLVFGRIVFPQVKRELALIAGMTFLWTLGDFAVAKFFLPSGSTLTLLIENLMTSYRIQGAILLGLIVIALGGVMQLILWRISNVDHP